MAERREPVSVICVFSDAAVRKRCLDRSLEAQRDQGEVEFVPVDNTDGAFATAGEALNHGASLAGREYLAFVHQDVYLHSIPALERAAAALADDPGIGILGAAGITGRGEIIGRIRDRVILSGKSATRPYDVDSVDEVLFMTSRKTLGRMPFSESPELGWHAYAVELGLRASSHGLRVCAIDIPLTHNSLNVNVDRLDAAYAHLAALYPDAMPLRATCGTISPPTPIPPAAAAVYNRHKWRYRWLRESLAARAGRSAARADRCVLADIRLDIDDVISQDGVAPILVVNIDSESDFAGQHPGPLDLVRGREPIVVAATPMAGLSEFLSGTDRSESILLTNLDLSGLREVESSLPPGPRLLGFRQEIGYWLLLGPAGATPPWQTWRTPQATPAFA